MTQTALEVHFGSPSGLGQAGLGQAQPLLYADGLAPIVYSGHPIGINLTESSSPSVGARAVGSGGEGLYGRPRPVPWLICGGSRSHPHHRATIKALPSSTQPPSPLRNPGLRLRLMPIGRPLRASWKRLQYGRIVCSMCTVASVTLCWAAGRQSVRLLLAPVGIYRRPGERRFEPWSPPYSLRIACVTVQPWIHCSIRQFATGMKYSRPYRGKYYGRLALQLLLRPMLLWPAIRLEQALAHVTLVRLSGELWPPVLREKRVVTRMTLVRLSGELWPPVL